MISHPDSSHAGHILEGESVISCHAARKLLSCWPLSGARNTETLNDGPRCAPSATTSRRRCLFCLQVDADCSIRGGRRHRPSARRIDFDLGARCCENLAVLIGLSVGSYDQDLGARLVTPGVQVRGILLVPVQLNELRQEVSVAKRTMVLLTSPNLQYCSHVLLHPSTRPPRFAISHRPRIPILNSSTTDRMRTRACALFLFQRIETKWQCQRNEREPPFPRNEHPRHGS